MEISIDQGKKSFNWPLLVMISSACLFTGIYRDGFSTLFPFLQEEFQVSKAQLGLHSTFFFLTSSFSSVFTGRFVDKRGFRYGILLGVTSIGFLSICHAFAPTYSSILILAALTGFGVSLLLPSTSKGVMVSFPHQYRSFAMGINLMGFPLGGIFAATIIPSLAASLGWRLTIMIPGILALLYCLFLFFFYQERREGGLKGQGKESIKKVSLLKEIGLFLKNPKFFFLCILGFFLGFISGIIASHFTLFLYLDHGLTETLAGLGFGVVQTGSVLGRPGWGYMCHRLLKGNHRRGLMIIFLFFSLLCVFMGLNLFKPSLPILYLLAFFLGYSGRGWQGLFFTSIAGAGGEQTGMVVGLSMVFVQGGLVTGPPLFGLLADILGSYTSSWFFLGLFMLLVTIGQSLYCKKGLKHH